MWRENGHHLPQMAQVLEHHLAFAPGSGLLGVAFGDDEGACEVERDPTVAAFVLAMVLLCRV